MKPGLLMLPSAVSNSRVHNILPNKIETDFQFSRASAATRVNHQGLIENVGYFSDELIQNGDFSELGPELITNGDFATDSDWTLIQATISNGAARFATTDGSFAGIRQSVFTVGKTYLISLDVSNLVGTAEVNTNGGTSIGLDITTNGTKSFYMKAQNTDIEIKRKFGVTTASATIDNVSVKQVDPDDDWVINGEWEYIDNGISITNATGGYSNSALYQLITLDSSKQYKATIDVSSISGGLQVYTGSFSAGFTVNTTGVKSFILDLTSVAGRVNILPNASTSAVIKSFSLVEVIGDKPRLDYDPINPTCPHLLLEPQSTNLVTFSNDFSKWNKGNNTTVTANYAISPDGTQNATRIQTLASTGSFLSLAASMSSGIAYAFSIYIKNNGGESLNIGIGSASGSGINGAETIVTPTNEWVKYEVLFTADANSNYVVIDNRGNTTALDCLIFGAQLEQQSYVTSYIPTAGATVTRVGETCTNAGNVDTFNSEEGVLYAEIAHLAPAASYSNQSSFSISDGTTSNRVIIYRTTSNNNIVSQVRVAGVIQANEAWVRTAAQSTEFSKIAFKYETNKFSVFGDGNLVATDTSGSTLPANTLKNLSFNIGTNGNEFYGKVKSLATYNRALTDNELYTITSTQYSAYSGMVAALGNYTIPC